MTSEDRLNYIARLASNGKEAARATHDLRGWELFEQIQLLACTTDLFVENNLAGLLKGLVPKEITPRKTSKVSVTSEPPK